MKIIIVGLGKVGYAIAQQMVGEEHDLILVDESAAVIEHADATLDAMCVEGNGACASVLLRAGIPPHGNYLCFALRRWKGFEEKAPLFGAAAEYAYRTYGLTPVFVAVEKHLDPGAGQLAARGLTIPHYFLDDAGGAGTIIGALSRMQAVVSMRLHALIFAAGQGVPLIGVAYDPKVTAFLDYVEQNNYIQLAALNEKDLSDMIDAAVALVGRGEEMRRRTELLNRQEDNNRATAARLLGKE